MASIISSASDASDTESKGGNNIAHVSTKKNVSTTMTTRRSRSSRRSSLPANHVKHYVEHNYHDHYFDPVEESELPIFEHNEEGGTTIMLGKKQRRGHRGGVAIPFPEKLHYMLSQVGQEGNSDVVTWQPHGRCFIVHKPKEFVNDIMPRFFRQTKLTSFQRQLNLYGFARLTAGPDRGGYYHELFIRGRMDLCRHMVRTRVKGNGSKAASSPQTEPNFYMMPPCGPDTSHRAKKTIEQPTEFAVIEDIEEDIPNSIPEPADITIELPMDVEADCPSDAEEMASTTTPPASPRASSVQTRSTPPVTPSWPSFNSLPVVTPVESRKLLSARPDSSQLLSRLPTVSSELNLDEIHSGDQIFFEGLPFHYLETKDVEDSLLG